jgi:hypothetical protein
MLPQNKRHFVIFRKKRDFSSLPAPQRGAIFLCGAFEALLNGDTRRYVKWIQGGYSGLDAETIDTALVFLLRVYQQNPRMRDSLFERLRDMDDECQPLVQSVTKIVKKNNVKVLNLYRPVNNSCQSLLIAKLITGIVGDREVFEHFSQYLETFTPAS